MSFCKNCGYMFISENDNMCGNCGTPRGQGNKFCSNCGASVYPDQNNCTMCGYFVGKSGGQTNTQTVTPGQTYTTSNTSYANEPNGIPLPFQGAAFNNANSGYPVQQPNNYNGYTNQKSRLAAGLLGIFLGGFGIHNFYLGYTNRGILQLALTIVGIFTSCFLIGIFIVPAIAVWGFVEGIMILCGRISVDANGVPLKND